jgi:tetratricopeptide (TPR) repeat protein
MSVRALRDLERGRSRTAQRRSADVLADALGLGGEQRRAFLASARRERGRSARPLRLMAPLPAVSTVPPVVSDLVGRGAELDRLRELAVGGGVVAVVGQPGVGKTTLAVSAADELRSAFVDGCLWVDLRGMDEQPLTTRAALDRLLRGLGVPPPLAEADQVDLYRRALVGRRVLVVLDNAADETQVRSLLAAEPGCLTLVTCRRTLAGLEGVQWLWLDPLAGADAVALLASIVGPDRVRAEPEAAAELVALCGELPLAVRIVGNRLATRPHWSVSHLVGLLRDERTRLSSLSVGDMRLRSAFELSYHRLSPAARVVCRRLAAVPGADFGVDLAEVATGVTGVETYQRLDELADASLLQAASAEGRFQFHDLIRLFAVERWEEEEAPADRERLSHAVLARLLATASSAGRMYYPDDVPAGVFPTRDEAGEWLSREESNWIAAQREAARLGWHREVLEFAVAMHWYSDIQWMGLPWVEIFRLGVEAARGLGDRRAEAKLLNFVGWAESICLGDHRAALTAHERARTIAIATADRLEETWSHAYVGTTLTRLGRVEEALDPVRKACVLAEAFDFWAVQISVRDRLGRALQAVGRHEEALAVHRALLADADRHKDGKLTAVRQNLTAIVMRGVGNCLLAMGEWRSAAQTFHEARQLFIDITSTFSAAETALNESTAWLEAGEHTRARECLQYALTTYGDHVPTDQRELVRTLSTRLTG